MRYLSQRYTMPYNEVTAILTDIGTEELAHIEMICAIVYQLTVNADICDIENTPFASYYIGHTKGIYPVNAAGVPWSATFFQSKGDPITDLHEDMAAEQKARTTYDNLLRLTKGTSAYEPLKCLRAREVVHYQRFGEALRIVQDNLDANNFYAFNPEFDIPGITKKNMKANQPNCQKKPSCGCNHMQKNDGAAGKPVKKCPSDNCKKNMQQRNCVQDILG
ncbi:MAG: manganese catalase family protein [Lachnospira sp.]|nr:manganese catalase family protein [Lachnospira sp.]